MLTLFLSLSLAAPIPSDRTPPAPTPDEPQVGAVFYLPGQWPMVIVGLDEQPVYVCVNVLVHGEPWPVQVLIGSRDGYVMERLDGSCQWWEPRSVVLEWCAAMRPK